MYEVDISPKPLQIGIRSASPGGGSGGGPRNYITFVDINDQEEKYVYVDNGILYISDVPPNI